MKKFIASLWQRRWCRVLGVGAVFCLLPLVHPFIRQSIFGPTIDGVPWCVWEDEIRAAAEPQRGRRSWFGQLLADLGMGRQRIGLDRNFEALPVYLHLTNDSDVIVRRYAISQLRDWRNIHEDTVPTLRGRLDDDDPLCRLWAAQVVWFATKERETIEVVRPLQNHEDLEVRRTAVSLLCYMSRNEPSLFDNVAKFANDPDAIVRMDAVNALQAFGKRALPLLRHALRDPDKIVRLTAIRVTSDLRADGAELYPELLALQTDAEPNIRRNASHALYTMDPKQFAKPATWVD